MKIYGLLPVLLCVSVAAAGSNSLRLPHLFTDSMVLQRDAKVPVWGKALPGAAVSIRLGTEAAACTTALDSTWKAFLKPRRAGGPHTLIVSAGTDTLKVSSILFGDVWLCSGQSNMEFPVSEFPWADQAAADARNPDIRIFRVPKRISLAAKTDLDSGLWKAAVGSNILPFSATAYWFGKELNKQKKVPIGLIQSAWGGTNVETWTSPQGFSVFPEYAALQDSLQKQFTDIASYKKFREAQFTKWFTGPFQQGQGMTEKWFLPQTNLAAWTPANVPGQWDSAGLKGFTGAVWYKTTFAVADTLLNKPLRLMLGKIYKNDLTWVNGTLVGYKLEYHRTRDYAVPAGLVKKGANDLTIRVVSRTGNGGFTPDSGFVMTVCADTPGYPKGQITLLNENWKMRPDKGLDTVMLPQKPDTGLVPNSYPSLLYNGMIAPLGPVALKGVIWYQGESNAPRAVDYARSFPNLITDWRNRLGQPQLPFLFVQLANFNPVKNEPGESDWAELREAQTKALALPKTGMAVIIDIGEADDIHPKNKMDVGKRLAVASRKAAYNEPGVCGSPLYKKAAFAKGAAVITFDCFGSALAVKPGFGDALQGFAMAGEDKVFKWAKAVLKGNTVVVSSAEIKNPVAVRYAWADNPGTLNLVNREGLPVSPFRTDDWPLSTAGKKYELR